MAGFREFFTDVDGGNSFKRLQAAVVLFLFALVIISNLFWGFVLSGSLTELLVFVLTYTFTGITIEKFTKRGLTSIEANDEAMIKEVDLKIQEKKTENAIDAAEKLEK